MKVDLIEVILVQMTRVKLHCSGRIINKKGMRKFSDVIQSLFRILTFQINFAVLSYSADSHHLWGYGQSQANLKHFNTAKQELIS